MKTYTFNIDRKCTIWYREYHEVQASSKEEAEKIMIENFTDGTTDETFSYQEALYDTLEDMFPEDNGGHSTFELVDEDGDSIADNTMIVSNNSITIKNTQQ